MILCNLCKLCFYYYFYYRRAEIYTVNCTVHLKLFASNATGGKKQNLLLIRLHACRLFPYINLQYNAKR